MSYPRKQRFYRLVYNGASIARDYDIVAVSPVPFDDKEQVRTVAVNTLDEYESGCMNHADCFGHMCMSPSGAILPPQSMSMRSGDVTTEYNKAARLTFRGDTEGYKRAVARTNYTKHGTMRSVMSSPVAGSCRLIASPQWEFGRGCIAISENLAAKMKVCYCETFDDGVQNSKFKERTLQENDWVIAVRPPSFHLGNTQPMRVKFWEHDCIGIHPESFSAFHGDFDGDEVHMYPVLSTESIAECESWEQLPLPSFTSGRALFNSLSQELRNNGDTAIEQCDSDSATFLSFTTLSTAQIKESPMNLVFGQFSRNKQHHLNGFHKRFNDPKTEENFVTDSIRGMSDVARQQLSQGELGYMTRTAKVIASCFFRSPDGGLYLTSRNGNKLLVDDTIKDSGTPCVRGVAYICAVAQQAALDAHRAESHNTLSHDFVADLVIGSEKLKDTTSTSQYTFVEFRHDTPMKVITASRPKWIYKNDSSIFCLIMPHTVPQHLILNILSCHNPILLSLAEKSGMETQKLTHRSIKTICNYYGITISPIELHDVSWMYSYLPSASKHSITTSEGAIDRDMGWIETLLASDYTKLPLFNNAIEIPNTSTACSFVGNFDNLVSKSGSA